MCVPLSISFQHFWNNSRDSKSDSATKTTMIHFKKIPRIYQNAHPPCRMSRSLGFISSPNEVNRKLISSDKLELILSPLIYSSAPPALNTRIYEGEWRRCKAFCQQASEHHSAANVGASARGVFAFGLCQGLICANTTKRYCAIINRTQFAWH